MEKRVMLNIKTKNGDYVIPFLDLKKLDGFTAGFGNETEMIDVLNRILDLSIEMEDVISINISSDRYKEREGSSLSCIKYSNDNWNIDSLRDVFSLYLRQNHKRIRNCDVRHVNTDSMLRFQAGMPISDKGIELAVKVFLNMDYKKQRDTYFMIRDFGNIRIDKSIREIEDTKKNNLSSSESYNDEFIQYLIELAGRGEEYLDKAMEELSRVDLEDISRTLEKGGLGIFDGLGVLSSDIFDEDAYVLVEYTGMSIDELKSIQPSMGIEQLSISGFSR